MGRRSRPTVRLFAPAKVNLGLEITGKRPDGYHEVVTVLEAVSLFDVIDIQPASHPCVVTSTGVPEQSNLVTHALNDLQRRCGIDLNYLIRIEKRIPEAAGLGGGSSDAGRVLAWLRDSLGLENGLVHEVASSLGSDVPFFLNCGTALARATGTELNQLDARGRRWYVLLTPNLEIPGKTGELYRQLDPGDFTDGRDTLETAKLLESGSSVEALPLRNTFLRPLLDYPPVRDARDRLFATGARLVLPLGAGPSLVALFNTFAEAAKTVRALPPDAGQVQIATSVQDQPGVSR